MANILMIIAPENFRDEEYFEPKTVLESEGHLVTTASNTLGEIIGSQGKITQATTLIANINAADYDLLLLVGGPGSYQYDENVIVHKIINDFCSQNKLVTAICHAPIILAKAGILGGKKATVFSGDNIELQGLGVDYVQQPVVEDGMVITADGPLSATQFGKTIAARLNQ